MQQSVVKDRWAKPILTNFMAPNQRANIFRFVPDETPDRGWVVLDVLTGETIHVCEDEEHALTIALNTNMERSAWRSPAQPTRSLISLR